MESPRQKTYLTASGHKYISFPLLSPYVSPRPLQKIMVPSLTQQAKAATVFQNTAQLSEKCFPLPPLPSSHLCDPIFMLSLEKMGLGRGSPLAREARNVTVALFLLFHIKAFAAVTQGI